MDRSARLGANIGIYTPDDFSSGRETINPGPDSVPQKAMNLNSYVGPMGGHFRAAASLCGAQLAPRKSDCADLFISAAGPLIALDAGSLLPDLRGWRPYINQDVTRAEGHRA